MVDRVVVVGDMGGWDTGWAFERTGSMTYFLCDDGWQAWVRDEYVRPEPQATRNPASIVADMARSGQEAGMLDVYYHGDGPQGVGNE